MLKFWRSARYVLRDRWNRLPQRYRPLLRIVALCMVLVTTLTPAMVFAAHGRGPSALAKGSPNTYHPAKSFTTWPAGPRPGPKPILAKSSPTLTRITHPFAPTTAQQMTLPLLPTSASDNVTGDGLVEVTVPSGAVTPADLAANGGKMQLVVELIDPPAGSSTGGLISLGTYAFQVQDATGHEVANGVGLRQHITVIYHWPSAVMPVDPDLDPFFFAVNGAQSEAAPITLAHVGANTRVVATFQRPAVSPRTPKVALGSSGPTLSASVPLTSSSTTGSFGTNSPNALYLTPDALQNDLHTGDLSMQLPIAVPQGPGGLTPPVYLSYNSGAVSATHNPQAAATWVGEGWSLDLGAVTWSESDDPNVGWRNTWNITDPFGTNAELIPPHTNIATYYDDSPWQPVNAAITWHAAPENHAKIISYTNPTVDCANFPQSSCAGGGNYGSQPPCFRMWLPNGIMEEFGCTVDSRQFYPASSSGTTNYVSAWKLDLITDPSGNQIHITYKADTQTRNGVAYPRDLELNTISWDSPGCHNANVACSSWTPLMQVTFDASHTVTYPAADQGAACVYPNSSNAPYLRCDDAMLPAGTTGIGSPELTATQVLNDVQVQVRTSTTGSWNTLHQYQFAYKQEALNPATIIDPVTGQYEAAAGYLLLEQLTEYGTDGIGSGHVTEPIQTFKYVYPSTQFYEDSSHSPASNAGCQPGPNYQFNTSCALWARTYAGFYLAEYDNGQGLQQTFSWVNDRNNTHGVTAGFNNLDPGYCTRAENNNTADAKQYPCDLVDDNAWSHITLTQRTGKVLAPTTTQPSNAITSTWNYNYDLTSYTAQECSDCAQGMYWGNANDRDYLDYYNLSLRGYAFAESLNPDGSLQDNYYDNTQGIGVWSTSSVTCLSGHTCQNAPYWNSNSAEAGRLKQEDIFNPEVGSTWPLMTRTLPTYTLTCPPSGVSGSTSGSWSNNLVAELDQDNPIAVCNITPNVTTTYQPYGATNSPSSSTVSTLTKTQTFNSYGQMLTSLTQGNNLGTTPSIRTTLGYVYHDAITTTQTSAQGIYIVDRVASNVLDDNAGNQQACSYVSYDGQAWATGSSATLTTGLATQTDKYQTCSGTGGTGKVTTKASYDTNGNPQAALDADAVAGINGHTTTACTFNSVAYTNCTRFDGVYGTLPISETNALGQQTTSSYATDGTGGFGQWPTAITDLNSQQTAYSYDTLGRMTTVKLPGEASGYTTKKEAYSYTSCPTGPSATASTPCVEVDTTQRLSSSPDVTMTSAAFYDGWGHLVETRMPAPNGNDSITYYLYDSMGRLQFKSQPYFVTSGSGYSTPNDDSSHPGTSYKYDALGEEISVTDPLSFVTSKTYAAACNVGGTNDASCYDGETTLDANLHQQMDLTDALGREVYHQDFTGTKTLFTLYRTTKAQYDYLGNVKTVTYADGTHTATSSYNALNELTTNIDPDLGNFSYGYDPNGNLTSAVDGRGTSGGGAGYFNYDGLNRLLWEGPNSDGTNPYASYTYDSTANGSEGIGRLTNEAFTSNGTSGSYAYIYDNRGRMANWSMTIGGTTYPFQMTYNDADQITVLTYPDGDTVTTNYTNEGWLSNISETLNSTTNTLLNSVSYQNMAGAAGIPTNAQLGNGANGTYNWAANYDINLRLNDLKVQPSGNSTTLFEQMREFDQMGNVVTESTTLPSGTDNQTFCYDEQDRLLWAGSTGTPSCGTPLTQGTLGGSALYTQTYAYDTLDRFTMGPLGSGYTYGTGSSGSPLDGVINAANYSAIYDAAGDMTGRGANVLSYDAVRRLTDWQNTATMNHPSQTANYAYDGEGERVMQQANTIQNPGLPSAITNTTTTYYIGSLEEVSTTSQSGACSPCTPPSTATIKYYNAGVTTAESVNGTLLYLAQDSQGGVSEALDATGNVTASQLFLPYGAARYQSGTMPTSFNFTGQRSDPSGLLYDHARYYDASVGSFMTGDVVQGPNRYSYVHGNPVTLADPTGNSPDKGASKKSIGEKIAELIVSIAIAIGVSQSPTGQVPVVGGSPPTNPPDAPPAQEYPLSPEQPGPTSGGTGPSPFPNSPPRDWVWDPTTNTIRPKESDPQPGGSTDNFSNARPPQNTGTGSQTGSNTGSTVTVVIGPGYTAVFGPGYVFIFPNNVKGVWISNSPGTFIVTLFVVLGAMYVLGAGRGADGEAKA